MRLRTILTESVRNLAGAPGRTLGRATLAAATIVLLLGLGLFQQIDARRRYVEYLEAGGEMIVVRSNDGLDPEGCRSAMQDPLVLRSGWISDPRIARSPAAGDGTFLIYSASPEFPTLLQPGSTTTGQADAYVGASLGERLGIVRRGAVPVDGAPVSATRLDAGPRTERFDGALVVVADEALAAECWFELRPGSPEEMESLAVAYAGDASARVSRRITTNEFSDVSASPATGSAALPYAAVAVVLVGEIMMLRYRNRELALYAALGARRRDVGLILATESWAVVTVAALWAAAATLAAAIALHHTVVWRDALGVYVAAVRVAGAAGLGVALVVALRSRDDLPSLLKGE